VRHKRGNQEPAAPPGIDQRQSDPRGDGRVFVRVRRSAMHATDGRDVREATDEALGGEPFNPIVASGINPGALPGEAGPSPRTGAALSRAKTGALPYYSRPTVDQFRTGRPSWGSRTRDPRMLDPERASKPAGTQRHWPLQANR